jgi:protein TonB
MAATPALLPLVLLMAAAFATSRSEQPPQTEAEAPRVVPPQIILETQKPPEYPSAARAARFDGTVLVKFTVLTDGSVGNVEVVECRRKKLGFEEAAIEAVQQWRFEPAVVGDQPVEYTTQFRLNFRVPSREKPYVSASHVSDAPEPVSRGEGPADSSSRGPVRPDGN